MSALLCRYRVAKADAPSRFVVVGLLMVPQWSMCAYKGVRAEPLPGSSSLSATRAMAKGGAARSVQASRYRDEERLRGRGVNGGHIFSS